MSNTVITNYTDLNGPSTKADSSVVVIVNKDGSLSVDQNLLGTLMGTDGSQSAGISVVRVGHEGKPDDATDSEGEDDKIPHVTLTVDSYYDEPNSIIKYDSGAEMLQSLRIETRENSLVGFQNDHCYTSLTSPSQVLPQQSETFGTYDEPVIEITHTPPPKPVPSSKKITILNQQIIIPKSKKSVIPKQESPAILKGRDVLNKPLPIHTKSGEVKETEKALNDKESDDSAESTSSSSDSIPDRDSDSDYKDRNEPSIIKPKKPKPKARILQSSTLKSKRQDAKLSRFKSTQNIIKKENKINLKEKNDAEVDFESILPNTKIAVNTSQDNKVTAKGTPKPPKKEKKAQSHQALITDMTSLFSTPDVIRRVSTDNKIPGKIEKESLPSDKKAASKSQDEGKVSDSVKPVPGSAMQQVKQVMVKTNELVKKDKLIVERAHSKGYELIPHFDDASLAQILQDTTAISTSSAKSQPTITTPTGMNSPALAGPLSPTLELLGGIQPEEEGLTEDLLMHVAQLVESSENLQEVIDKQVLGKVDTLPLKVPVQSPFQQAHATNLYTQTLSKTVQKAVVPRKEPIEIVRRDGRVITLPPIEAPATRSSKRKSQIETSVTTPEVLSPVVIPVSPPVYVTPEPQILPSAVSKQYINKKLTNKKQEPVVPVQPAQKPVDKISVESQESWNSEDDPNRLWCICKQPHNNRFMICCDGCEDWFHGKCVNITKAMGQQMEEQGIEWRCPNCIKKTKGITPKSANKTPLSLKRSDLSGEPHPLKSPLSKTGCIVCKKAARASSIYCSDACILKHAQDSLAVQPAPTKDDKTHDKKADSRVIVYERKSGRLLAGPNAPTAENLKSWLQKNPTFEVVRPGALSSIKPGATKKKGSNNTPFKVQTTLNFERIPKKSQQEQPSTSKNQPSTSKNQPSTSRETPSTSRNQLNPYRELPSTSKETPSTSKSQLSTSREQPSTSREQPTVSRVQSEVRERRSLLSRREEMKPQTPKTPVTPKSQSILLMDTPKPSTSIAKSANEPKKLSRNLSRSLSLQEKNSGSPTSSRRKDSIATENKSKMNAGEADIRENVRKSLQEQFGLRMAETKGSKFTEDDIRQFADDTESELQELFRDVGMKYKARYRSLMFNIKDRKNLTLWQKICDRSITPKQLVRLSPEELASQELAEWRDQEAKHQLELIKKSELDLLAASKTYVLKTHKGEEVMETKEATELELDPNVPIEDVVTALNDSTVGEEVTREVALESKRKSEEKEGKKDTIVKKRERDDSSSRSKRSRRDSRRDSDRKSRSSRKKSQLRRSSKDRRRSTRKIDKKSRTRSSSRERERSKRESKEKSVSSHRSRSRDRRRLSKAREYSRSTSKGRERSRSRRRSRSRYRGDEKSTHRSRSQENYIKNKTDSTDSDSVERPKSAMQKDPHPEYDPHEPMITSALSEEDLRKTEDPYEDKYKSDIIIDTSVDYDPSKSFTLDSSIIMPSTFTTKQDKTSEAESDQEPSSTVENAAATVWNGCINMVDVARFYVAAYEVSGSAVDLEEDLSTELDIVGRINPETVWDYITKTKKASNKDIVVLRLQAANDEEKMQYIALYSYLSSRNRLGVVKVPNTTTVKDFYIVPLASSAALPAVLAGAGAGLPEPRPHLLVAIVVRPRRKRPHPLAAEDILPAKVSRKRSFSPRSPSPRRALPLPLPLPLPPHTAHVKDKINSSLDDEAYSPSGAPPASLRTKMEELNRQIEEQKQQILKMAQADSSMGEDDEAYSPSRPLTPPGPTLADISLPSNLQEILATIKQRSEHADQDMRQIPLP